MVQNRHPGFLSLKWKALLIFTLVLTALSVAFVAVNYRYLWQQFEQQKQVRLQQETRQLLGLLTQSAQRLQQSGETIPRLTRMPQALQTGNGVAVTEAFDNHWPTLQLEQGIDLVRLYAADGRLLGDWRSSGAVVESVPMMERHVGEVLATEMPATFLDCPAACVQYAVVPMLVDGRSVGVAMVGGSLAEAILTFKSISGADIGILNNRSSADDAAGRLIGPWRARVWALTDMEGNLPLLESAAIEWPHLDGLAEGVTLRSGDRVFEVALLKPAPFDAEREAHVVVVHDVTPVVAQIQRGMRDGVMLGLAGLGLSGVALVLLLRRPLSRLLRVTTSLPLLARGEFGKARTRLVGRNRPQRLQDEFDVLESTAITLAEQLERLKGDVEERSESLRRSNEVLARERNFVTHLLDTAQVVILTQDADGKILSLNHYGELLTGSPAGDLVGRPFASLHPGAALPREVKKELDALLAGRRVQYQVESTLVIPDGTTREVAWLHSNAGLPGEAPILLSVGLDISARKLAERQLTWLADHDSMTGLLNRRRFQAELESALAHAGRYGRSEAVLYVDINKFKYINDTAGHSTGDDVLVRMGQMLDRNTRESDVVARLGGDEFALILHEVDSEGALEIAQKLADRIGEITIPMEGRSHRVTTSIGVALFPDHGRTAQELLVNADIAMYEAKSRGVGWHLFSDHEQARERMHEDVYWQERLKDALANDRFVLFYQPIMRIDDHTVSHYEALLRLRNPDDTLTGPMVFIPAAERNGMIHAIDHWVIRMAVHRLAELVEAGHDVVISVNISAQALQDQELPGLIRRQLEENAVEPRRLILEITETAAVLDFTAARQLMDEIRALGCRFALDDFGVGFSSFMCLKQLPLDFVKLDGAYIRNLSDHHDDQVFVRALSEVAKGFGKTTIAEFVDKPETLALLQAFGVQYAQGYLIGKPLPGVPLSPEALEESLRNPVALD